MKTTYSTRWGSDTISVTADWSQASCPVEGIDDGRRVADFQHSGWRALEAALRVAARADGLGDERWPLIEKAIDDAVRVEVLS